MNSKKTNKNFKIVLSVGDESGIGPEVILKALCSEELPKNIESGLAHAGRVVNDTEDIGVVHFDSKDIVRHPLVRKIIDAYKRFES